ncbi:MAG: hypothetical protein H2066_03030 [Candidatus Poseidoniales archaeon]|nr:hypothetical protein [Candidatus Poseidoniales archaeon]
MELMDPPSGPRMLIARMPIADCLSVLAEDIPRATAKRLADHNSGRLLLEKCLEHWELPIDSLEVLRTEHRAPYLSWLNGVWRNEPLPGISIGHSGDWAVCALIEPGYWIGIDAEPKDRGIQTNAFDMMAKGEELDFLIGNSKMAIETWTAKEAVQKAEKLGMHLNPRDINLTEYNVESFIHDDLMVSVSWREAGDAPRSAEDDLLDATLEAMKDNPNFSVGCKTTRNNV